MVNEFNSQNDYRDKVVRIVDFLKKYSSKNSASMLLNFGDSNYNAIFARENFSKMLWAAIPFINGGGYNIDVEDIYRFGTINGTNPLSSEYWGDYNGLDRKFNVMVPVACGLLMNSDIIFNFFTQSERQNISNWLYNINCCKCNVNDEQFFVIIVNSALRFLGRTYDKNKLEKAFEAVEKMYINNGWYGTKGNKNYNITLTLQFYSLIYAKTMMDYDENRCKTYLKRAEQLLVELYKSGALLRCKWDVILLSFCSACLYAGVMVDNLNIVNIINKIKTSMAEYTKTVVEIFKNYINNSKDIEYYYNTNNFLTWYMKAFLVLALPNDHKFWKAS